MSDKVMMSLRLPSDLATRLGKVAEATERTRTYVATKAIEEYVESEEEIVAKIRKGLVDADAGQTVSHADALAWVEDLKAGRKRIRRK